MWSRWMFSADCDQIKSIQFSCLVVHSVNVIKFKYLVERDDNKRLLLCVLFEWEKQLNL